MVISKHSYKVRLRAFTIWQQLGDFLWRKPKASASKRSGDFYKGAFDSIPFLNDDAKRTFVHLLLRPGYMIRDYIKGDHERYLAPLTALIIFYAFFGLVTAVLQPVQQHSTDPLERIASQDSTLDATVEKGWTLVPGAMRIVNEGYTYLTLDRHPESVDTRFKSALAALEGTLRSQGIPLFLGQFLLLWLSLYLSLKRYKISISAAAATSAYILCQFSFFMLFAVLLSFGEDTSIGLSLMAVLLTIDLHQLLGAGWKQSFRLTVRTGIWYTALFTVFIALAGLTVVLLAWIKGTNG